MSKRKRWVLQAVLAAGLGGAGGVSAWLYLTHRSPQVITQAHELPVAAVGAPVSDEFLIQNPLSEPVQISDAQSSCPCALLKLSSSRLPPNGTASVHVAVKGASQPGSIEVSSSVTGRGTWTGREVQFALTTNVRAARVIAVPKVLPVPMGSHELTGEVPLGAIRVADGEYPLDYDKVDWRCEDEFIRVDYEGVSGGGGTLTVTAQSPAPIGEGHSLLTATFWRAGKQLSYVEHLPIQYTLTGPVRAAPRSVLFGSLRIGQTAGRTVRVKGPEEQADLRIASVHWEGDERVASEVSGDEVTLKLLGEGARGPVKGCAVLGVRFNDELYRIRVPCLGYIATGE